MSESNLEQIIRDHSRPLEPEPVDLEARLERIPGLKAVLFDVYGTLFISGSGDISLAEEQCGGGAMVAALAGHGVTLPAGEEVGIEERFFGLIRGAHARRVREGIEFPEVEIREIWRELVGAVEDAPGEEALEAVAVEYECRVNPVWPMPGLEEVLEEFSGRGLALGIVSNSQFYTPLLFPALAGKVLGSLGFSEDLCVWSYRLLEGKPARGLYECAAGALEGKGISPGEALYVGNDMVKDVRPAAEIGFRTALFAGDGRSLRTHGWKPGAGGGPDVVVTGLRQLLEVV